MKTIVIAAGYATRLYPLTENFPKPLLAVGESTILDRLLDDIDTIPGIDEHIVVTNARFAPIFDRWAAERAGRMPSDGPASAAADGSADGFSAEIPPVASVSGPAAGKTAEIPSVASVSGPADGKTAEIPSVASVSGPADGKTGEIPSVASVSGPAAGKTAENPSVASVSGLADGKTAEIPSVASDADGSDAGRAARRPVRVLSDGTFTNETRLGAVRDLILALEAFGVDEDVLVVAADNILEFSLKGFVEEFRKRGTSMIMCHYESELKKLQRTGVIEVDGDMKVLQMQEKPEVPVSNWAVPPFYIYRREDLGLVRHSIENGCGADAPGNLARYLVSRTPIHAWPMPGPRFDIGSLDTYEQAQRRFARR